MLALRLIVGVVIVVVVVAVVLADASPMGFDLESNGSSFDEAVVLNNHGPAFILKIHNYWWD